MTQDHLMYLLKSVDKVTLINWNDVMQLVKYLQHNKDNVVILENEWYINYFRGKDFFNLETWSTYDSGGCIYLTYIEHQKNVICDAEIWDGDNAYGYPINKRFNVKIELPPSFVFNLESNIMWKVDSIAENQYNQYLKYQKKNWIDSFKKEFVNFPKFKNLQNIY